MATRGFKVPLTEDNKEVPGYLMGFTGADLERLEQLKTQFDLKEEQDVVRLALRTLEKMLNPEPPRIRIKQVPKVQIKLKSPHEN